MATKTKQAAQPAKNVEVKLPEVKKAAPAKKVVPEKKTAKEVFVAPASKNNKKAEAEKKSAPAKKVVVETIAKKKTPEVKKDKIAKPIPKSAPDKKSTLKQKPEKSKADKAVIEPIPVIETNKKGTAKKDITPVISQIETKVKGAKKAKPEAIIIEEEIIIIEKEIKAVKKSTGKEVIEKPLVKEKKVISKNVVKQTLPVKPISAAQRPTATPAARSSEKKSGIIIAHRKMESKLKLPQEPGNTMVSYQPETYRSILDEPEQPQGPVYRYSDEELYEFRVLITSRLESARKELNYLQGLITRKDEAGTEDTENRFMNMEDGSGAMEREQLAQLASRQIQFINHLEKAMVRVENKTYGICRVTGKLIDKARLRAVPHATLSIEAKKTMASKQN